MSDGSTEFFDAALLSEAAYTDWFGVNIQDKQEVIDALTNNSLGNPFPQKQENYFLENWKIVSHQANTDSGFSATLFKNKTTGEFVYAVRGSQLSPGSNWDANDAIEDALLLSKGLAFNQISDLYNDWKKLITPLGESYEAAVWETVTLDADWFAALGLVINNPVSAKAMEMILQSMYGKPIIFDGDVFKRLVFKNSEEAFGDDADRQHGEGRGVELVLGQVDVTGHSLSGHLNDVCRDDFKPHLAA